MGSVSEYDCMEVWVEFQLYYEEEDAGKMRADGVARRPDG